MGELLVVDHLPSARGVVEAGECTGQVHVVCEAAGRREEGGVRAGDLLHLDLVAGHGGRGGDVEHKLGGAGLGLDSQVH